MLDLWLKYVPVVFLLVVSLLLIFILFFISYFLSSGTLSLDFEKLSVYECGFDPFTAAQGTFDIKFYILAMLYLIFDLEIMFLLPWVLTFNIITWSSLLIFLWFTFILTVAFVFEWMKGALDWQ